MELPLIRHGENGSLVLVDGSVHQGFSFGAQVPIAGEVVFNTGKQEEARSMGWLVSWLM